MIRPNSKAGFTLIELLVVIAIIAILAAAIMPAIPAALDRSRVNTCRSNLTHISIALRMYYDDQGGYPPSLAALDQTGFITDDTLLLCTKTGAPYYYKVPQPGESVDSIVAARVDPKTPPGQQPHSFRNSLVILQRGGMILEVEAGGEQQLDPGPKPSLSTHPGSLEPDRCFRPRLCRSRP